MTTLERVRVEIQKVLDAERDFTSENAKAQAIALSWVLDLIDKYAEQEPCDDNVSRQAVLNLIDKFIIPIPTMGGRDLNAETNSHLRQVKRNIEQLPSVRPQEPKHCKDCKYFEYDSVAKVDGVPLIVAHEICNKWGNGCKTKEDGYCFLFEPQESEE